MSLLSQLRRSPADPRQQRMMVLRSLPWKGSCCSLRKSGWRRTTRRKEMVPVAVLMVVVVAGAATVAVVNAVEAVDGAVMALGSRGNNNCHQCGKLGHWAGDCHSKQPKKDEQAFTAQEDESSLLLVMLDFINTRDPSEPGRRSSHRARPGLRHSAGYLSPH
jgi:hypothetical protein